MSFPTYQNAVRLWLSTALAGRTVIYGHQDGPKPGLSFVEVRTIALVPVGMPDYDPTVDVNGDQTRRQKYRATVACHFRGAAAETDSQDAHRALGRHQVHDAFRAAGVSIESTSGFTFAPENVDGKWEPHWTFDAFLGMLAEDVERVGWIAHVEIKATVIGGQSHVTNFVAEL